MTCLKCGRETDQTFCEECRAVMAKYPVKPGIIVQLPKDRKSTVNKRIPVRRAAPSSESQLVNLKKTVHALRIVVLAQMILLAALCGVFWRVMTDTESRPVGQNYSIATKGSDESVSTQPTEPPLESAAETR